MNESYESGLATTFGPESCGAAREVRRSVDRGNMRAGYTARKDTHSEDADL